MRDVRLGAWIITRPSAPYPASPYTVVTALLHVAIAVPREVRNLCRSPDCIAA